MQTQHVDFFVTGSKCNDILKHQVEADCISPHGECCGRNLCWNKTELCFYLKFVLSTKKYGHTRNKPFKRMSCH